MLLNPVSTVSAGNWTPVNAASLHEALAKASFATSPYITSPNNASGICEVAFDSLGALPIGGVELTYSYAKEAVDGNSRDLAVELKKGTSTVYQTTHVNITESYVTNSVALNVALFSDLSDITIIFTSAGATGGGPAVRRAVWVSWAALSIVLLDPESIAVKQDTKLVNNIDTVWVNNIGNNLGFNSHLFIDGPPTAAAIPIPDVEYNIDGFVPVKAYVKTSLTFLPVTDEEAYFLSVSNLQTLGQGDIIQLIILDVTVYYLVQPGDNVYSILTGLTTNIKQKGFKCTATTEGLVLYEGAGLDLTSYDTKFSKAGFTPVMNILS